MGKSSTLAAEVRFMVTASDTRPLTRHHSRLTRKGQATIPAEMREKLDLKEGDELIWAYSDGALRVTSARCIVRRTAGIFKDQIPPLLPGNIEQRMAEEDEALEKAIVEDWQRLQAETAE